MFGERVCSLGWKYFSPQCGDRRGLTAIYSFLYENIAYYNSKRCPIINILQVNYIIHMAQFLLVCDIVCDMISSFYRSRIYEKTC